MGRWLNKRIESALTAKPMKGWRHATRRPDGKFAEIHFLPFVYQSLCHPGKFAHRPSHFKPVHTLPVAEWRQSVYGYVRGFCGELKLPRICPTGPVPSLHVSTYGHIPLKNSLLFHVTLSSGIETISSLKAHDCQNTDART